ncbi:MAG: disulfide bond formation protein B [Alphaproteobacteria bacterium]|nr:disulfide bond formation protein B [Alphaproteobacteria bacterium]
MSASALSIAPDRAVMALIAAASLGALGTALVAQFGFDLWPCLLCYVQRAPYAATLVLGLLASMPAVDGPSRRWAAALAGVLFLVGAGTAGYHVGVEERWWKGPAECVGQVTTYTPADLLAALNRPGQTGCEEAAFRFLGISMAGYNMLAALVCGLGCFVAARRADWWR